MIQEQFLVDQDFLKKLKNLISGIPFPPPPPQKEKQEKICQNDVIKDKIDLWAVP